MKLVVGLGNPGREYDRTRHNMGYMVVERLADEFGWRRFRRNSWGLAASGVVDAVGEVTLLLPTGYMNRSGVAVGAVVRRHRIALSGITVLHDDLDLPTGRVRVRRGGSSGGHRGIESIIDHLGAGDFVRIKIGIGRPPVGVDPADYVLTRPSPPEAELLGQALNLAFDAVRTVLSEGAERAMNLFNVRDRGPASAGETSEAAGDEGR